MSALLLPYTLLYGTPEGILGFLCSHCAHMPMHKKISFVVFIVVLTLVLTLVYFFGRNLNICPRNTPHIDPESQPSDDSYRRRRQSHV